MYSALQLQIKKRGGQSLMATNDIGSGSRRLYIKDKVSKTNFLIDTGSDVSVYPRKMLRDKPLIQHYELFAANGSKILTYGTITLQPDFGLRRSFPWRFIIADIVQPIIGSDFLAHFHLLPDVHKMKLIDGKTGLSTRGTFSYSTIVSIKTMIEETHFHRILT